MISVDKSFIDLGKVDSFDSSNNISKDINVSSINNNNDYTETFIILLY